MGVTFGGNHLAIAIGNIVLEVVREEGFLAGFIRRTLLMKHSLAAVAD